MTDEKANATLGHYLRSEKCVSCKDNPVAKAVIRELLSPNKHVLTDYAPTLAVLPCEGKDAYEIRVRFFIDGIVAINGDVSAEIWKGIREAMKNYQGDGLIGARIARQKNPKHPYLPLPKFLNGKRGAP